MVLYGATDLANRQQAYDLLAHAVSEQWGLPQLPVIAHGTQGKPYFPALNHYEFNLSHSGALALCGLDDRPVGVDIQVVKPRRAGLTRSVCSDQELAWLERGEEIWTRFALLWALKECRVKHSGTGLTRPISAIRIPLPDRVGELSYLDGLWFRTYGGAGWRGAACGLNPPPECIFWLRA